MSSEVIELLVGAQRYGGWKSVRVSRSIEGISGSFALSVSDRWENQAQAWPIVEDSPCTVLIDGVPVITGYVDKRRPSFDAQGHGVTIEGRDRAGDVADCSAQLGAWSFASVNVLMLAQKLCQPYGVPVSLQRGLVSESVSVPKKYSIDPGDTAATALGNLCKVAGLLAISDGFGGLVLTRAGAERLGTSLVQGDNILSGSAEFDTTQRFRNYEVMGSHKGRDDLSAEDAAGVRGTATDLNARAGRTKIIRPDTGITPALANARAQWEATVRAGRGESASVTVQGWKESPFEPVWPLNKLVHVKSSILGINGDALIAGVTFSRDIQSGTLTTLDLRNPKAFTPDPTIGKNGAGNNYWREIEKGV